MKTVNIYKPAITITAKELPKGKTYEYLKAVEETTNLVVEATIEKVKNGKLQRC